MQRFYFPDLEKSDDSITIKNKELINQLTKVLRVNIWEKLSFFNWTDNLNFIFEIISIDKREVYLEKLEDKENKSEIEFDLNIFAALPNKLEKIEYTIKKAVEVWVSWFYFFRSERSQKLNLSENKISRLNKIIIEAVEQSGRSRIPELIIDDNINIEDFKDNQNLYFHTNLEDSKLLKEVNFEYDKWINLFVWPEWGFSDNEIDIFSNLWFNKICRVEFEKFRNKYGWWYKKTP